MQQTRTDYKYFKFFFFFFFYSDVTFHLSMKAAAGNSIFELFLLLFQQMCHNGEGVSEPVPLKT